MTAFIRLFKRTDVEPNEYYKDSSSPPTKLSSAKDFLILFIYYS